MISSIFANPASAAAHCAARHVLARWLGGGATGAMRDPILH
jgi:hypothetical protein